MYYNDDVTRLVRNADKSFYSTERANASTQWNLLAEFILNNQWVNFTNGDAWDQTAGRKSTSRLFDSTAVQANADLAAAIHSTLTNPAHQWSKLRFKSEKLNNDEDALEWLNKANEMIHSYLGESNFNTQVSKNYEMYSSLGTMALLQEPEYTEGEFSGFKFTSLHLAEIAFSENSNGVVDCVYRKFRLTARQAYEKFGNKVPEHIMEELEENPDKEFGFYHILKPRDPKKVKLDEFGFATPKKRPFASYYIERKSKEMLEEGGYYEFPIMVTRWSTMPGEVYGRGPGHIALPEIRTINTTRELLLHSLAKAVDPPFIANAKNILGALDLRPAKVTIVKDLKGIQEMPSNARFDVSKMAIEAMQMQIKSIFYIDKLLLPPRTETGEMTAFEVAQRLQQMLRVLGPTLSRLNSEFLSPLIIRSFKMILREKAFPDIPTAIAVEGLDVDIAFINQLSRSQQLDELNNIQDWVQRVAALAQLNPQVLDTINVDGIAKLTAKILNVPEEAVNNNKEVAQIRSQREQLQQSQQAMDMAQKGADIKAKLNGANNVESKPNGRPSNGDNS